MKASRGFCGVCVAAVRRKRQSGDAEADGGETPEERARERAAWK